MEDWMCEQCNGSGKEFPECKTCEGQGWIDDPADGGTKNCPECENAQCPFCNGTGEKP